MPSNQQQIIEQAKFTYSALEKALEKQTKTIKGQGEKQADALIYLLFGKSKTKGLKTIFSRSFSDFIPLSVHKMLNLQEIKNITYMYIKRLKNSWGNIYIKT